MTKHWTDDLPEMVAIFVGLEADGPYSMIPRAWTAAPVPFVGSGLPILSGDGANDLVHTHRFLPIGDVDE